MEVLITPSFPSFRGHRISTRNVRNIFQNPVLRSPRTTTFHLTQKSSFKNFTAVSPTAPSTEESPPPDQEIESEEKKEKFDWYENWYPVAAVCDLDKRRPHGRKVIGMDIVVWWDRNENAWKVFDDSCPHRLAPLSEGRIDQWGRLQCVYHGWCFGGAGDCKFIPQAPRDGPPIHTSKKACVAAYPTYVQNRILWFWPNSDPKYKDIHLKKKPHYIPELDDPSYSKSMMTRDLPYGYEVLIENLMDPSHGPYAHYGMMEAPKADREGGTPIEFNVKKIDVNGYSAMLNGASNDFIAPCLFCGYFTLGGESKTSSDATLPPDPSMKTFMLAFYCIPVSPGRSRLIFAIPGTFVPRWIFHIVQNLFLDSDLYLLHEEERKLMEAGPLSWHKSCFIPTKADGLVVAFRTWLSKYGGTQVDWRNKYTGTLPPSPPREQLMDRYWSHTVNCSSCNFAYKNLSALEVALPVISIGSIAVAAAAKQGAISIAARYSLVSMAVVCFVASKWLSHFIYKTFRYHDYDHAFR